MKSARKIKQTKRPLNILMFNRWVGYNHGGNETHIKELADFLMKKGHSVSMLTTGNEALDYLKPRLEKIYEVSSPKAYYAYKGSGIVSTVNSLWFLVKSFAVISKAILLDHDRIDVLSVHFSLEAFLARFVRLVYGIPYILVLVGDTDFELLEGKYADVTVQISNFMADECKKFGYRPRVLTKGVDRGRFNTDVNRDERKNFLDDTNKEKLVIAVCRLDPRKNLETLINAAEITKKTNPEIKYLIVGGGVEEEKLKNLVKEKKLSKHVYLTGMVPSGSDRLPKLYRAADLFVLPTLYEGFGYVYAEAMACGLPVISTDTSAVPEVVADVGIIVPIKSPKILAQKVVYVLTNEEVRQEMIRKGGAKVDQWYWDTLIDEYDKAYIETFRDKPDMAGRITRFARSLSSMVFLVRKTLDFITNPSRLRWGPTGK